MIYDFPFSLQINRKTIGCLFSSNNKLQSIYLIQNNFFIYINKKKMRFEEIVYTYMEYK